MSITKRLKKIKKINTATYSNEYVRPKEWLSIPDVSPNEQVIYGLHVIRKGGESVYFEFNDDVIVDWGDGTVEVVSLSASHTYDYDTYDIYNTNLLANGNKQVLIKIIPAANFNLQTFNFSTANAETPALSKGWMDIVISAPYLSSLTFASEFGDYSHLEQIQFVGINQITSFSNMFADMTNLRKIVELYTGLGTTFNGMFNGCNRLMEIPVLDLSNATTAESMFANCNSIEYIPPFNMSSVIGVSNIFSDCTNLKTVSPITFGAVENIDYMFSYCINLKTIPFMDFSTVISAIETFSHCPVEKLPLFDFSSLTNAMGMFTDSYLLTEIPAFDFTNVTSLSNIFSFIDFTSLKSIKILNIKDTISLQDLPLNREALIVIFNNLADNVTAKTINVVGCLGTSDLTFDDVAIAENKGWTVTLI